MSKTIPFSDNKKLTVINLLGGPGVGKSVLAAELFAAMKKRGFRVELIHEVAKDFTWERWYDLLGEQDYIFAHQHRLQRRLVSHDIDYVIVDSSLLLGLFYMPPDFPQSFRQFILDVYNSYNNMNFYIKRSDEFLYDPVGRNQTKSEAMEIDRKVYDYIITLPTYLRTVTAGDSALPTLSFHIDEYHYNLPRCQN